MRQLLGEMAEAEMAKIDAGTERCGVVVSYAFLIMRLIQIRNTAPMIATTIVPMNPPA
jgi:hypothetical protein